MKIFKIIKAYRWAIPYILHSFYLNLKYLPFKQAIKMPILVCKPEFKTLKGSIIINYSKIHFGMITLGKHTTSIYPKRGVMIENLGTIIFNGQCHLDSGIKISVHKQGILELGNHVHSTAETKIICKNNIHIGKNTLIGWDCLLMDNSFHQLYDPNLVPIGEISAPICIGDCCWLGHQCTVLPGATIPDRCVIASHSLVNKSCNGIKSYSLLAGTPAIVKKTGIWRPPTN